MTLDRTLNRHLSIGLEYNPLTKEVQPRATWFISSEAHGRPSVVLGFSADRLAVERGHNVFLTFSKSYAGGKLLPFVSVKTTTMKPTLAFPFGLNANLGTGLTFQALYDSNYTHLLLTYSERDWSASALWARTRYWGVQVGYRF